MLVLPSPLGLRPVAAADLPFIDALFRSTRDDLAAMAMPELMLTQLLRMQQEAQTHGLRKLFPQADYFLLEREGQAIGRLVIDAAGERVHLVDLALCPSARNLGVGSAVLRALQTLAARRHQPLLLSVAVTNAAARRLYLRHDFIVTGADAVQESLSWHADRV